MALTVSEISSTVAAMRDKMRRGKALLPLAELKACARAVAKQHGFLAALETKRRDNHFSLIAEIKKASPPKGLIRPDFDPLALAQAYAESAAACLSVLTDTSFFHGAPKFLTTARNVCVFPTFLKDLMSEPYQAHEARAWGTDATLIIIASLSDDDAKRIEYTALEHGFGVLIEAHDEEETGRALKLKSQLLGINNRNLRIFEVSLKTSKRLAPIVPADRLYWSAKAEFFPTLIASGYKNRVLVASSSVKA